MIIYNASLWFWKYPLHIQVFEMTFKTKLLLVLAGLLVVAFSAVIYIIDASASTNITKTMRYSLDTAVTLISSSLEEWNRTTHAALVSTAKDLEELGFENLERMNEVLKFTHDGMAAENAYVTLKDGRTVGTIKSMPKGFDPRKRAWFQEARAQKGVVVSAPYRDAITKKIVLTYSVALSKNGVFQGVLGVDLLLDNWNHVDKFSLMGGRIHILDRKAFVVRSRIFEAGSNYRDTHSYKGGKELTDEIYATSSGFMEHNAKGVDKFYVYTTVSGLNWKVLGVVNKQEAFKSLRNLQMTLLITALTAIGIVLAVLFGLIHILFKPLLQLRDLIIELVSKEGDLTKRLTTKGKDEIAVISKNINAFLQKPKG